MASRLSREERDPLLLDGDDPRPRNESKKYKPGPLEISRTTRYGILAGIWAATFLSVCNTLTTQNFICMLS